MQFHSGSQSLNEGSLAPIPPVLCFIMELWYPNKG